MDVATTQNSLILQHFQAGAFGNGPGPNFGRNLSQNRQKLKYNFEFPNISLNQLEISKGSLGADAANRAY